MLVGAVNYQVIDCRNIQGGNLCRFFDYETVISGVTAQGRGMLTQHISTDCEAVKNCVTAQGRHKIFSESWIKIQKLWQDVRGVGWAVMPLFKKKPCKRGVDGAAGAEEKLGSMLAYDGHLKFRAASLIKVPIVAALFYQAQSGGLELEENISIPAEEVVLGGVLSEAGCGRPFTLRELARLAIVVSDNTAANLLIKRMGFVYINRFIQEIMQAEQTELHRYFMHSPEHEGENYTTPCDCLAILAGLWREDILKGALKREFWDILSRQQFIEKLPSHLLNKAKTYNKTGELDDGARHDMAVIETPQGSWAVVVLTDQQIYPGWEIDDKMANFSELFYQIFEAKA